MASSPVLDIDALLRPVAGEHPGGVPLPDEVRQELDTIRREPDPWDTTTAHWKADWPKVLRTTTDFLTGTGKDMHAAARLLEAATKVHGTAGLRDGLILLGRLVAECWDQLHPAPSDGDTTDIREAPVLWLNDVGKGARFPHTVASLPLFRTRTDAFGPLDMRNKERKAAFDEAVAATKPEQLEPLRAAHADLLAARQALGDLATALTARRVDQNSAPNYLSPETSSNLGTAIGQGLRMVEAIARTRGFALVAEPALPPADPTATPAVAAIAAAESLPANTREGLYTQIEQVAAALRRLEPHSPIPFLLDRCVKLGRLPFPELMRAMLRENAAVDELDRLLGLDKKE